jgi:hypothetical protein
MLKAKTKAKWQGRRERANKWREGAYPFFWLLWLLLLPSIAAAAFAPNKSPGYALDSAWLYRLEVGGAFYMGLFVLVLIFWLGYTGRSVGDVQTPVAGGVGNIPPPNPGLDDAAEGLSGYRQKTDGRLEKLEQNIELLLPDEASAPDGKGAAAPAAAPEDEGTPALDDKPEPVEER